MFSKNREYIQTEFTTDQAKAYYVEGLILSSNVDYVSLKEGARLIVLAISFLATINSLGEENKELVKIIFVSNTRTIANISQELGQLLIKREEAQKATFRDDVRAIATKIEIRSKA